MDPEDREKLEQVLELSEENNEKLSKMERMARWSTIFRVVYWIIVIGAAVGLFYYIQPYINQAENVYNSIKSSIPIPGR